MNHGLSELRSGHSRMVDAILGYGVVVWEAGVSEMSTTTAKPLEVDTTSSSALFGWLREGTPAAQRSLLAASLGWMLDGFDIMLYALVLSALLRELSISTAVAGILGSITLVASGIGGILFGIIADRYGRRRALIGSVLVYSVFTAACRFAQSIWQLAVFRFVLGLGMGGEWTSGAAIVSETWPDRHRGNIVTTRSVVSEVPRPSPPRAGSHH